MVFLSPNVIIILSGVIFVGGFLCLGGSCVFVLVF